MRSDPFRLEVIEETKRDRAYLSNSVSKANSLSGVADQLDGSSDVREASCANRLSEDRAAFQKATFMPSPKYGFNLMELQKVFPIGDRCQMR